MSAITKGLRDAAVANAALVALVSTYRGGPAIFTGKVPDDAVLPYVFISDVNTAPGVTDVKNSAGRDVQYDVFCFAPNKGSTVLVEDMAEEARKTYQRQPITIAGFTTIIASVNGPIPQDDDEAFGRVLTVTLTLSG